jgi:2-polyprenyl-3-methyl-5-hydroxy-6-metoxy-1,4-benzoquinol methylase
VSLAVPNDRPPFSEDESREGWNAGAAGYDRFIESGADYYRLEVHGPALLRACGDVAGLRVLDLGCGQGYFTRALAAAGADALGVDLSDELVALAVQHERETPLGAAYRAVSAAAVAEHWPAASFDRVTACMSVQDMADVGAVFRAAHTVLRPGGRMVFSVPHPLTDTPYREWDRDLLGRKRALKIAGYFERGAATCDWNMPRLAYRWTTPFWRYTLGEWCRLVTDAGFLIRAMDEPRPTAEQIERRPELADCAMMPYFLLFDACRA